LSSGPDAKFVEEGGTGRNDEGRYEAEREEVDSGDRFEGVGRVESVGGTDLDEGFEEGEGEEGRVGRGDGREGSGGLGVEGGDLDEGFLQEREEKGQQKHKKKRRKRGRKKAGSARDGRFSST